MYSIQTTAEFDSWLGNLQDLSAVARVRARLVRAAAGNLGDVAAVGGNVSEMRIHVGPGYRVYFTQRGAALLILLAGGAKSSQLKDIRLARRLAQKL